MLCHAYAVVLFYSCSAALDTLALPRAFLPTSPSPCRSINYMQINDGKFHCRYAEATADAVATDSDIDAPPRAPTRKVARAARSRSSRSGGGLMIFGRKMLRDAAEGGSQMKDSPFVRSLILLLFLASGILSIYKYAFLAANITDNVARMFAMFGLLLQFAIIASCSCRPPSPPPTPSR